MAIWYSRILKQSALFKNVTIPNSRPLIPTFYANRERVTYTFILSFFGASFSLLLFCSGASSCLTRACIVFLVPLVTLFRALYFLFIIGFCIFFRFSYLCLFCHCSKVTTISLSRWCLGLNCALFAPSLHRSSSPSLPSRTMLVVF